jgi:hypothetical protein
LGGEEVALRAPDSLAVVYDISGAARNSPFRAMWASLGVCWPAPVNRAHRRALAKSESPWRPLEATLAAAQYNAGTFGGLVFDELTKRGLTADEINGAAAVALDLVMDMLPDEEDDAEALADFSEGPADSTS